MNRRTAWASTLRDLGAGLRLAHRMPVGLKGLGVWEYDRELWRIGGEWLAATGRERRPDHQTGGPDVYLATQVHRDGGHTALIGDFVRALSEGASPLERAPHLIVTNAPGDHGAALDNEAIARTAVSRANTHVLNGASEIDRLDQLFDTLLALRPRRLFLFHHPDDPLPVVVARPEVASRRVLVHHADARLSFGLHLPGMQLIDLNPIAAATSRLQGLVPALLRLSCPDPGPRTKGFLRRERLVTATSTALSKISAPHFYRYSEIVGRILRATGGWHVHIGELDAPTRRSIHAALQRSEVASDRFVHLPWTPSVATTLWEHDCDVYVSSFPIDGARTNVEIMASATPHLRFAAHPNQEAVSEMDEAGGLAWHTAEDLEITLGQLASQDRLEERSRLMRAAYESKHHPQIFRACLQQILSGGGGADDQHRQPQDVRALRSLANASVSSALTLAHMVDGNSARARLLRWLLRI